MKEVLTPKPIIKQKALDFVKEVNSLRSGSQLGEEQPTYRYLEIWYWVGLSG